jgi:hypothetical protein
MQRRASPSLIVACALVMSSPSILAALHGALTINTLCVRLSLAFVASYIGVRTLTRLISGYAAGRYPPAAEYDDGGDLRGEGEDARL